MTGFGEIYPFGQSVFGVDLSPAVFSPDPLAWLHAGVGFALAFTSPLVALAGSLLYLGYQLSQVSEPQSGTATEVTEFGAGMLAGALLRGARA